jgi:hypothetical protein
MTYLEALYHANIEAFLKKKKRKRDFLVVMTTTIKTTKHTKKKKKKIFFTCLYKICLKLRILFFTYYY